jgi:hypothetical protein
MLSSGTTCWAYKNELTTGFYQLCLKLLFYRETDTSRTNVCVYLLDSYNKNVCVCVCIQKTVLQGLSSVFQ